MRKHPFISLLVALLALLLLAALLYQLPPVHERLSWQLENLRTEIRHALNPPAEAVFVPQEQEKLSTPVIPATSLPTHTPTPIPLTPSPSITLAGPSPTPEPSPTPTWTPTPIPEQVTLTGVRHEYQQMNNCGPATLSMALSYWGWQGDQRDTRAYLRPNFAEYDDKNVGPQEMVAYVTTQTGYQALLRYGGQVQLLKQLLAGGFPVIVEKGFQPPGEDWMGHYGLLTGYDDARQRFITQDAYIMADFPVPYADLGENWWRDFNGVYVVVYPPEREAELFSILGIQADPLANLEFALGQARTESETLTGRPLFFAWYNRGTNLLLLGDAVAAASAFDQAFAIYAQLPEAERPWRMLWYQTGPYQAYYQTGRYQDVIRLADQTLTFLSKPLLEETLYWRGLAYEALGNQEQAIADLTQAVRINPTSTAAAAELERLGVDRP